MLHPSCPEILPLPKRVGTITDQVTFGELKPAPNADTQTGRFFEEFLQRKVAKTNRKIKTIKNKPKNSLLPLNTLDVVVIANAYHEMEYPDEMLTSIRRSLRDNGLLAIIDNAPGWLPSDHETAEKKVIEDAARNGFRLERKVLPSSGRQKSTFYFLIFSPSESLSRLRGFLFSVNKQVYVLADRLFCSIIVTI